MRLRRVSMALALALAVTSVVGSPIGISAAQEGPTGRSPGSDALTRALQNHEVSSARYALERVRSLFDLGGVRSRFGKVARPDPRATTLLLRDLALRKDDLPGAERREATGYLSRPDDGQNPFFAAAYQGTRSKYRCTGKLPLCFHWAVRGRNAPNLTDQHPNNGIPDWVDVTIDEFRKVWRREVRAQNYRKPKPDGHSPNNGPNNNTDIYLSDVGDSGIYGYCTTDDPRANYLETSRYPYSDVSAYCVLDDDFSSDQFRQKTPRANLRVTAAHEFFHAIQFAYDFTEDAWLMEGTAAEIEDEVYDRIDDNRQYLAASPLAHPQVPVDRSSNSFSGPAFLNRYGAWIFWRFLNEHFSSGSGSDPKIMRQVWRRADGSKRADYGDKYSLAAAVGVVRSHGQNFREAFGDFAVANFLTEDFYEEGRGYRNAVRTRCERPGSGCSTSPGGRPPFAKSFVLTASQFSSGKQQHQIDHLASNYVRFARSGDVSAAAVLQIQLNAPDLRRGSSASALVFSGSGVPTRYPFALGQNGNETLLVPFGSGITRVVLVLSNGNTRFDCGEQPSSISTSCQGIPRFDDAPFTYTATVIG